MSRPHYLGPTYRLGSEPPPEEPKGIRRAWKRLQPRLWPLRARHGAAFLAAAVAGLGLHGLLFMARLPGRLPTGLDWRAAAALVERDARPGDAVALAPVWAERAREVLPEKLPAFKGAPLVVMAYPRYPLAVEDLVGVRRVWLLSLPEAPGADRTIARDLEARSTGRDGPQRLGAIEVTRYDLRTPVLPLAFLPDRLTSARVRLGDAPCPVRPDGAFRCPGPPWLRVAREVREVDLLPRPCLHAHPGPDPGAPLTIEFSEVPMGRVLRGHTGIVAEAALRGSSPVSLTVKVDGEELGAAQEPPRKPGWHAFEMETTRFAGSRRTLAFAIAAPDSGARWFCFDAMTLP
ncbi:MAG TPA: hypothetical protein VFR85_15100 [Anaeromyxobacteraceae bacterium]|nr:hypothetical protein [Anaeromyxobacteraceae bacterium]